MSFQALTSILNARNMHILIFHITWQNGDDHRNQQTILQFP